MFFSPFRRAILASRVTAAATPTSTPLTGAMPALGSASSAEETREDGSATDAWKDFGEIPTQGSANVSQEYG